MLYFLISMTSLLLAQSGPTCKQVSEQIEQKLSEQKKVEAQNQKLEDDLKIALQNEITAQVEKRDSALEQNQATQIYYQLRKIRLQKEVELRTLKDLQKEHCRRCPESPTCVSGRNRS